MTLLSVQIKKYGGEVLAVMNGSPTFFGWVFGFNGKVQILAPESVKEQYRQMIAQADEGMQQKENKRIVN